MAPLPRSHNFTITPDPPFYERPPVHKDDLSIYRPQPEPEYPARVFLAYGSVKELAGCEFLGARVWGSLAENGALILCVQQIKWEHGREEWFSEAGWAVREADLLEKYRVWGNCLYQHYVDEDNPDYSREDADEVGWNDFVEEDGRLKLDAVRAKCRE